VQEIATVAQAAASLHGGVPGNLPHPRLVQMAVRVDKAYAKLQPGLHGSEPSLSPNDGGTWQAAAEWPICAPWHAAGTPTHSYDTLQAGSAISPDPAGP